MMANKHAIWAAYFMAALLTLIGKLIRYVQEGKRNGKTVKQSICEWFFEGTRENLFSWIATVGIVWVLGVLYIERLVDATGILGTVFSTIPVHVSGAVLLGYLAETLAPNFLKWVISKFPYQTQT